MTWRQYLLLALLGLAVVTFVAALQPSPGYMDADYYYAGGLQLVNGHGFTEPYLWNYLDNPAGLPHPSHAYWMPLASLLAAVGAALFGPASWLAARIGFLLVAALIPPLTAALAWSFTSRRDLALTSGLLAVFPAFYLSFLPVTDTFGLYMLLGGIFFLILNRKSSALNPLLLGLLSGLMHLTRTDGLLWLLIAFLAVLFILPKPPQGRFLFIFSYLLLTMSGYLLVMLPWFVRNYAAFGTPLAPGGSKMLWLTSYDQLFSYPASQITFSAWWQSGLRDILRVRAWSLGLNLSNMLSVQGEVFLLPLIGLGLWHLRKDQRVKLAVLVWLVTLAAMTVVFPFAGARGGYFHSGASMQTVWWALAPVGLDRFIAWGSRKRSWNTAQAGTIFRSGMVVLAALLTAVIVYGIVMVANPPGFYLASGNPAIAVPDGDVNTLLRVARRYGAKYVILEAGATPDGLLPVYDHPEEQAGLRYLGDVGGAHIYGIQP
ncbi:MAG: hypothetical protein NTV38_11735 [Chloroflexi bacterium]|nr:hypothetical protein [Chloroflexota bacterium]